MEQSRAFRLYSQTEEQFYISPDNSEEDCTDLTSYDLGDKKNPPQPKVADGCGEFLTIVNGHNWRSFSFHYAIAATRLRCKGTTLF